jgi:Flp pilus assembly protein TadD
MKPAPPVRTLCLLPLAFLPFAFATLSAPAQAQVSCPQASGPDAEAGWTAYSDNDMTEAQRRFEVATARCDNYQYARTGLGYDYLRNGAVDEAERLWTLMRAVEPNIVDEVLNGMSCPLEESRATFQMCFSLMFFPSEFF